MDLKSDKAQVDKQIKLLKIHLKIPLSFFLSGIRERLDILFKLKDALIKYTKNIF